MLRFGCSSLQYGTIAAKQNKDIVPDHVLVTALIEESSFFLEFGTVSIFRSALSSQSALASGLVSQLVFWTLPKWSLCMMGWTSLALAAEKLDGKLKATKCV